MAKRINPIAPIALAVLMMVSCSPFRPKERPAPQGDLPQLYSLYTGPAEQLFTQAEIKKPAAADLAKYTVDVRLTDDPLEPTRIKIGFPDGSVKEIALNN